MPNLAPRPWVPQQSEKFIQGLASEIASLSSAEIAERIEQMTALNTTIHEVDCLNLNPATNVMNPKAESLLSRGLGSRPSLGDPGDKYEMGLEGIEAIEVITAELCAEIFQAKYAEIRVPSGAIGNLYAFMATCNPGDKIIVPPGSIGGHVTHHMAGAAGLYGLEIHYAPVNADGYTIDIQALRALAKQLHPSLITIGGSLNLFAHPVRKVRDIADEVGAKLLFDAAHLCGMIAGHAWENPLTQGAHLMTMSTYKSLGGPAGGLIVTNEADLAEKLDAIAFPGMTANFDAAKSAALAITMLDWRDHGRAYAAKMVATSKALAAALSARGIPVFATPNGPTSSHQFAIKAQAYGGGQTAAKKLRCANILTCGIGLPIDEVEGDMNGLRFGTPELVRWGFEEQHMKTIADFIADALNSNDPEAIGERVRDFRCGFDKMHFINP
ncbi:MAG: glycine hydroxymethyltransferase [Paracoccaceae bacterium]|jgi:glycine hydroxymethyltransferase